MRNKLIDLHNALFAELEALQDEDSFRNENGTIDAAKAELAIKKADAVSNVAGKIMDLTRIQLDAVKTANNMGIIVDMPETFGMKEIQNEKQRKSLVAPRY